MGLRPRRVPAATSKRGCVPCDLRLNDAKTYVSSFERGFSFLGWVFHGDSGYEEAPTDGWTHPMSFGGSHRRGDP